MKDIEIADCGGKNLPAVLGSHCLVQQQRLRLVQEVMHLGI
ncbi:hypothetical protein [Sinorhizobium meliloti]|nr:hypothetical protein [Sinorhizobium meliloti]